MRGFDLPEKNFLAVRIKSWLFFGDGRLMLYIPSLGGNFLLFRIF